MSNYARAIKVFEAVPADQQQLVAGILSMETEDGNLCWCALGFLVPRTGDGDRSDYIQDRLALPPVAARLRELGMSREAARRLEIENDTCVSGARKNTLEMRRTRFERVLSWMRRQN